jgi:broad specificity phosphatase PhoE
MAILSVSERRARRAARRAGQTVAPQLPGAGDAGAIPSSTIPHQAVTDSPSPLASAAMASGGENLVRGNSNLQPMTPQGHRTVSKVGQQLANLGGPDVVEPAASVRASQTAQDVTVPTGAPVARPTPALESQAQGNLEGEEKTPEVKKYLAELVRAAPNQKIPGQGAMSSKPGESFNEFRMRALPAVVGLMQQLARDPSKRILVPTSTQVIKLVEAWCAAGCPDDLSVNPDAYLKENGGAPGSTERFYPEPDGKWGLTHFNPAKASDFLPGIYFMRHGETDSVQAANATAAQQARARIVSGIRGAKTAQDWINVRSTSKRAKAMGQLSDQDISQAYDEALPTANDAPNMAPHELLNAASAASPAKRQELYPALRAAFGNMDGVSPEGRQALMTHLGRIGALNPQAPQPPTSGR